MLRSLLHDNPGYLRKYVLLHVCWLMLLFALATLSACQKTPVLSDFLVYPDAISIVQGQSVVVEFRLNQPASIDIILSNGSIYVLHKGESNRKYSSGRHTFLFDGLVQGYYNPNEDFPFDIVQRLVPDGEYRIIITADTGRDKVQFESTLVIKDTFSKLPAIRRLEVDPRLITPNEDGIDDAAKIIIDLPQDVEQLSIYAVSVTGDAYPIPELEGQAHPNAQGLHIFHFDSLDIVGEQLDNGPYSIFVDVYDVYGQHIRWESPLSIQDIGDMFGYIVDGAVDYSTDSVELDETLCFSLTVRNNGDAYMRTTGPWPSTVYTDAENIVSKHYAEDKGVYRIGLDFESSDGQYPFRWALGTPEIDLVEIDNEWYLPPNNTGNVYGCVEFTQMPEVNPQYAWIGLIHEQTTTPLINHRVAPHLITVFDASD